MSTTALDYLPDPLRRAVVQAITAEQMEGWRPSTEDVHDLAALAGDEVTFGTYLAKHRAKYPVTVNQVRSSRRLFRRHRPYLLPGTELLRNNFGAESQEMLTDLEFVATAGRLVQWHRRLADHAVSIDDLDTRMLHQHVFADVYPWAGNFRTTELQRGKTDFIWRSMVAAATADIEHEAREIVDPRLSLDADGLAYRLARVYANYNHVHPFREGNGRSGTLLLHTVVALRDRTLDLSRLTREEWYEASRDSTPFRRDGRANHRPFIPLLARALA
ncbi:MAG: Fic family protein [Mycobacterium sp.]